MDMKCISVYTRNFEAFSDVFDEVMATTLNESEEKEIEGIVVSESGEVPESYVNRMKTRADVVVMKVKEKEITILQHNDVFEILIPLKEKVLS